MKCWRPTNWVKERNIFFETHQPIRPYYKTRQIDFEAGAFAMLEALKSQGKFFATKDGFVPIGEEIIVPKHTRGYVVVIPD